ncbi:MAG: hypothetical protein LBV51_00320 [Acholeplasmatales bacterium]|jgi:hypothetical protein|nr:hypothetical protein [Acholeplasmatales bacterium]
MKKGDIRVDIPEYTKKYKVPGMAVKKVNNSYYLYSVKSSYIKGYKNPQPKYTYIGLIDTNGDLIKKNDMLVYEYGLSRVMLYLLSGEIIYMKNNGFSDADIAYICMSFIIDYSDNSYLCSNYNPAFVLEKQKVFMLERIKDIDKKIGKSLISLKNIYLVKRGKTINISKVTPAALNVIESAGLSENEFNKILYL